MLCLLQRIAACRRRTARRTRARWRTPRGSGGRWGGSWSGRGPGTACSTTPTRPSPSGQYTCQASTPKLRLTAVGNSELNGLVRKIQPSVTVKNIWIYSITRFLNGVTAYFLFQSYFCQVPILITIIDIPYDLVLY